jgi:hypothetical protein
VCLSLCRATSPPAPSANTCHGLRSTLLESQALLLGCFRSAQLICCGDSVASVSPARSGVCTFLPFFALAARRLATVEPWERFGKADQDVLTCDSMFAIPYTKPINQCWPPDSADCKSTRRTIRNTIVATEGKTCAIKRPAALARLKRPPSRLRIVRRYGYVHRLPYPAVILEIIAWLLGTPVESSTISASRKACSSSSSAERSTIVHVEEDKHHHLTTFSQKMTPYSRFFDAYVSCSYYIHVGSASPRTAGKCHLRNIAAWLSLSINATCFVCAKQYPRRFCTCLPGRGKQSHYIPSLI